MFSQRNQNTIKTRVEIFQLNCPVKYSRSSHLSEKNDLVPASVVEEHKMPAGQLSQQMTFSEKRYILHRSFLSK